MANDSEADGYTLNRDSIAQLRADHEFIASLVQSPNKRRQVLYPSGGGGRGVIGRALTAITPADNNLVGTSFDFVKFVRDRDIDPQTVPKTLKEELDGDGEPKVTKGANYSTKLSGGVDAFCQLHLVNGELVVFYVENVCDD